MATKPSTTHSRSIRRLLACAGTAALVAGGLLATGGAANAAQPAEPVVFDEIGFHVWTVPEGVTEVSVTLVGGSGGKGGGTNGGAGGLGASVSGIQAVTPGQDFAVVVGQAGGSGTAPGEDGEDGGAAELAAAELGEGGVGFTDGGAGGEGSFLARDGGGGGGSSAFGDYDAGPGTAAVAAGGAGGAGRGVVGFCVGGDGGNAGEDGKAPREDETAAPEGDPDFGLHCLAEGDGGLVNASDDGDGESGGSVLFLGGGGGGGGASFYGDGISGGGGGEAGALLLAEDGDPETPEGSTGQVEGVFGLGGGGGGGAGGGSSYGSLSNASDGFGEPGDGSVTIAYSVEYQTETTLSVSPASAVFGDEIIVTASVENLTTSGVPSGDVVLVVDQPLATTSADGAEPLAAIEPLTVPLVDGEAVFTIESGAIDAGSYHLRAIYQPTPISPFAGSEADTTLQVARIATTTQLAVDPTTVQAEKETVMTATVVGAVGVVPTGDIGFYYDGELLGFETLAAGANSVDVPISFIPVGSATITARYVGDVNFEPSDSNPVEITVTPIPTPTPTPTPKPSTKPAGLANTGSGAADILPWSLLLLAGGAVVVAGAAGAARVRTRR
jgi:hypothetical protein